MTTTWVCPSCGNSGDGIPPEECPGCAWEFYAGDPYLTEAGYEAALRGHKHIMERAAMVARRLGHGSDQIEFFDSSFETSWSERNCNRGCCGSSTHTESIPFRYLWMSDDDIKAEMAAKKAAQEAQEAEEKRLKALADAEAALAHAQARAGTAAQEAAQALADAERRLANLRGAS